jgi:hypothetical protein
MLKLSSFAQKILEEVEKREAELENLVRRSAILEDQRWFYPLLAGHFEKAIQKASDPKIKDIIEEIRSNVDEGLDPIDDFTWVISVHHKKLRKRNLRKNMGFLDFIKSMKKLASDIKKKGLRVKFNTTYTPNGFSLSGFMVSETDMDDKGVFDVNVKGNAYSKSEVEDLLEVIFQRVSFN